jgi:hypothetical protein
VHDLGSIEDLIRLAERYERVILHERRGPEHAYLVEEAGVVYRYRVHDVSANGAFEEAAERWTEVLRAAVGR